MLPRHPQKGAFVGELRAGERVVGFFQARHKQLEPFRDRSKGNFLTVMLGDRTGQILARVWEDAAEVAAAFETGDVIKVAGDVEEYLGRTQLIVQKLRPAQAGEYALADFLPATTRDVDALWLQVRAAIDQLENAHLAALVRHFYDDAGFRASFGQAPASRRMHHAYLGGLLEHLVDVLALSDAVLALYPDLSRDLLVSGALLSALGTLRAYAWETEITITDEGRLLGPTVLAAQQVSAVMDQLPDFPPALRLRVQHMLVSHRGRPEWGAPRRPQTLEAIALHHVEELSAQLNRFKELLGARRDPAQPWTDYDRLLGRQLYAGSADDLGADGPEVLE